MGKKRRVRWIVGSFVLLLLGFVVGVIAATNTPDARMKRVIAKVVEEYGFQVGYEGSDYVDTDTMGQLNVYALEFPATGLEEEIVARISESCEGCTVEFLGLDESSPVPSTHSWFTTGDGYRTLSYVGVIATEGSTEDDSEVNPFLMIAITRPDDDQGILSALRDWLPW